MGDLTAMSTFVVRLSWDEGGRFGAVIERVRSGKKIRIRAIADISHAIAQMIREERNPAPEGDSSE